MPCEMCGKEAPLRTAEIEGNRMRVCPDCAKFGKVIEPPKSKGSPATGGPSGGSSPAGGARSPPPKPKRRDVFSQNQKVLVEDYGTRIRKARQKKGLSPEELSD
ncbi:MAG: hypothetical protein R3185_09575, partial [Candidatus Thermoplasmatota archaeon]|nr:hypothetical protein [Candidatus Thermoplasmatota archaeon]